MPMGGPGVAWRLQTGPSATATVFGSGEPAADDPVRERIAQAAAGRAALAWVGAGARGGQTLTVLPLDAAGRLAEAVALPGGLRLPAGARVRTDEPGEPTDVHVALEGPDAGILRFHARDALVPWIRFSYAAAPAAGGDASGHGAPGGDGPAGAFGGLAFRILADAGSAQVALDPARPLDPARTRAVPDDAPLPSRFRTRWGAVVTLRPRPPESQYVQAYDPARDELYWTLDGIWDWGVAAADGAGSLELMPGVSGAEYVAAPAGAVVRFVAGAPAYADAFRPDAPTDRAPAAAGVAPPLPLTSTAPGIALPVQTAWIYPQPPANAVGPRGLVSGAPSPARYFSQPDAAGLFAAGGGAFLDAYPIAAADLPPDVTTPYAPAASFPAAPWSGLDHGPGAALERRFEAEVLTAARAQAIASLTPARPTAAVNGAPYPDTGHETPFTAPAPAFLGITGPSGPTGPTGPATAAVTPQGLLSTFSDATGDWERLVLAQAQGGAQQLALTDVRGKLREALLANRLFLVVSDVDKLLQHCSTPYRVSDQTLVRAKQAQVPPQAISLVARFLRGVTYATRALFDAELRRVLEDLYASAGAFFLRWSELAQLEIAGWTFDLSSWRWKDATDPTILVIMFADGDLQTLIDDRSRWTMPAEFNAGDGAQAQQTLQRIAQDARDRLPTEPELAYFVETVLAGAWNGVLHLNPVVPTSQLPPELAALAAGLPRGDVRAHHLGVTLSSFALAGRRIALEDSSLFGLILYEDAGDLVYRGDAYDFKVLSLKTRFANSAIASFSSQVELLVGQLFNELSSLPGSLRGDNLVFDGTLQRGAYRFRTTTRSRFEIASRTLAFVEVADATFVTVVDESTAQRTVARFALDGTLGFQRLSEADLFGYGPGGSGGAGAGGLAYSGLMVSMEFDPADPQATRAMAFVAGQATFDLARSAARDGSLPRRFPLVPAALRQSERSRDRFGRVRAATPADLGFITVEAPLPTGGLGDVWFGIELTMSFGSPGALAPQLGFTGALLLAWAPDDSAPNVAVGLRLPGSQGGSRSLTIMGPLKLSIGRLNLMRDETADGYLLRLANVALSFLGLSFPSGGKANALLFGDPDPRAANSALGWYAAYRKDPPRRDDRRRARGTELPCRTP